MIRKLGKIFEKTYGIEWAIWTAAGFVGAAFAATLSIQALLPLLSGVDLTGALPRSILNAIIYALTMIIVIGLPYCFGKRLSGDNQKESKKRHRRELLEDLGLDRWPRMRDLMHAVAAFCMYYGILFAVLIGIGLIASLFGQEQGFQAIMSQQQEIGFTQTGNSWWELILIFLSLVIIPPFCEEVLMRGFLFDKLSKKMKTIFAVGLTSLVFALAHWQLNVSIDTFILSVILCYARINTGSIWSGIFVHIFKNGLAFALLFFIL